MAVTAGVCRTFVITENAKVYGFGRNYAGILGNGTTEQTDVFVPIRSEDDLAPAFNGEHAIMVATSLMQCACVTEEGSLWTWGGSVVDGELFFGDGNSRLRPQCVVPELYGRSRARMVALGLEFAMLLTVDGHIWNYGDGTRGQLGHGDLFDKRVLTKIDPVCFGGGLITMISAGTLHSIAQVAEGGLLYTWGSAVRGALGHSTHELYALIPKVLPAATFGGDDIASFDAGFRYSIVVTVPGRVYATGDNYDGQLGLGHRRKSKTFQLVGGTNPFENQAVRTVSCGSRHSLFITNTGVLWSCGRTLDNIDPLQPRTFVRHLDPTRIVTDVRFKVASAGLMHSAAIACNGDLYTWGCEVSQMKYQKKRNGPVLRNYLGDFLVPKRMHRIVFSNQRLGRWHTIQYKRALAIMMSSHLRLASDSVVQDFEPELLRMIMSLTCFQPRNDTGIALRRLIGF